MNATLEELIKALVDHPEDVKVEDHTSPDGIVLKVTCNSLDMGRIIGKAGRTISSIRSLMRIAFRNKGQKIQVELLEPENPEEIPQAPKQK